MLEGSSVSSLETLHKLFFCDLAFLLNVLFNYLNDGVVLVFYHLTLFLLKMLHKQMHTAKTIQNKKLCNVLIISMIYWQTAAVVDLNTIEVLSSSANNTTQNI